MQLRKRSFGRSNWIQKRRTPGSVAGDLGQFWAAALGWRQTDREIDRQSWAIAIRSGQSQAL